MVILKHKAFGLLEFGVWSHCLGLFTYALTFPLAFKSSRFGFSSQDCISTFHFYTSYCFNKLFERHPFPYSLPVKTWLVSVFDMDSSVYRVRCLSSIFSVLRGGRITVSGNTNPDLVSLFMFIVIAAKLAAASYTFRSLETYLVLVVKKILLFSYYTALQVVYVFNKIIIISFINCGFRS